VLLLLIWHGVLAAAVLVASRWLGPRGVFLLAATGPAASALLGVLAAPDVLGAGSQWTESWAWAPTLGLSLSLRVDALSLVMLVLVGGVGTVIFAYTAWYAERARLGRFAAAFVAFAGAMAGLVLADDVIALYVFWELTTVCSYVLIGLEDTDRAARRAATQALLVTTFGGLAMRVGLIMLSQAAGTSQLSAIVADPPSGDLVTAALVLVLIGAFTKSAQVPFHPWLPAAMAAPTPVSAYLHAAAMVKAGVYLVLRLSPAFADLSWWRPTLVTVGVLTMLVGGWRALRAHDLKQVLAFSTVSQLGFLVGVGGWGAPGTAVAATVLLLAHGLAKAAMFLSVGAVDHATGTRDLRQLDGVGAKMPVLATGAGLAALSLAGFPPLLGFVAKEEVYSSFLASGPGGQLALAGFIAGSVLTVAYCWRFWWGMFARKSPQPSDPDWSAKPPAPIEPAHAGAGLVAPVVVLAGVTLLTGAWPALWAPLVGPAATAGHVELALWHGLTPALGWSALTLAVGLAIGLPRGRLAQVQTTLARAHPTWWDAQHGYDTTVSGVDATAARVTGRVQSGSLPVYLTVIVATAVLAPTAALLARGLGPITLPRADEGVQLGLGVAIVIAAVALAATTRRLVAVLILGAIGYAVALLFVVQGAPDLALTQFLVETLTLVIFLFVLRLLPTRFTVPTTVRAQAGRAAVAIVSGAFVALMVLAGTSARTADRISAGFAELALTEAEGHNLVNLILVDFRGLDTLGEITVILTATLGVSSLVLTVARPHQAGRRPAPARRSVILETAVLLVFHTILAVSVFFLVRGHNAPGGGFIGGLVAGAGLVLRYLAYGNMRVRADARLRPSALLGSGLVLAAGAALTPMLLGGQVLASAALELHLPVLGTLTLASPLIFDTGVYLIVVGLVLGVLSTLGAQSDVALGEDDSQQPTARELGLGARRCS
jgi:multicomponent Na+:H+ antiporter subunit A